MRRHTTAAMAATTLLGAGAAVATVAAGRWAVGAALGSSRRPRPAGFGGERLAVHATGPGRVTLTRSVGSRRPGTYGLTARGRHAVVGPVLDDVFGGPDTVVRKLERVVGGDLAPGTTVELTPQIHTGDPRTALGIPFTDVSVPGESGPLPAWFVPGPRTTWVIALHGLGATREHPLNLLPFLREQRFPVLIPVYRGDPGAPRSRDRVNRLGADEWRDAEAAVRYAVRYGAERVVLYGWSAGGAMALRAAVRSPLHAQVAGLVLDSPVLEPAATFRSLAADHGVPARLLPFALGAANGGFGLDTDERPPGHPTGHGGAPLPVMIFHGPDDSVAPWRASRELAAEHPESVTLHTVPNAGHAAMWNADPAAYEERLRRFLTPLM
ncbi:alpha/beta hydrolase [Streptomyces sp. NBC_01803]|uniref:alpha/beta hydrolase n=1 Tax=Streptomyces sp. NBC_01803 TaxID=2975946 RepID=UPI002DDA4D76|nr:alpha/beta fold hydrolase [Streptomyces sp. NBC_01803]WSA46834.1 alpha/beta hydrolase [Streptomyces sp. NBC_01803]